MEDKQWYQLIRDGEDEGWRLVWERVVEPESLSMRSAGMMKKYSLTSGDLMGMLYNELIGRRKIDLYRGEGSLEGWLRRYVRGFVLNANPMKHNEISLEGASSGSETERESIEVAVEPGKQIAHDEVWLMTHICFKDLWNSDPERAYVLILKTRFHLSSEEIRNLLDISSTANVDQIFSRSVKFMRAAWLNHDPGATAQK